MWKKRSEPEGATSSFEVGSTFTEAKVSMENRGEKKQVATIGPSIKITGEVSGQEDLVIHGQVDGKVEIPHHTVVIGREGTINADVFANIIHVEGTITGDIQGTEQVVVHRSGNVRGNVTAPRVTLEDGAKFKGTIDMDPALDTQSKSADRPVAGWNPSKWDSKADASADGESDEEDTDATGSFRSATQ